MGGDIATQSPKCTNFFHSYYNSDFGWNALVCTGAYKAVIHKCHKNVSNINTKTD